MTPVAEMHIITIVDRPYFSAPVIYQAKCSCGEYDSDKQMTERQAADAGADHVAAKEWSAEAC